MICQAYLSFAGHPEIKYCSIRALQLMNVCLILVINVSRAIDALTDDVTKVCRVVPAGPATEPPPLLVTAKLGDEQCMEDHNPACLAIAFLQGWSTGFLHIVRTRMGPKWHLC
eukprot:CAMPEP_0179012268 /NCGR_PEP_ID=MMETSP0796-20121207/1109_1 /TAXON_ID=73915 /ORGANISM="Pyrodinium bahamense, Strain pbaha01" /LENGTH=112 /DNA_ID=CAMNT_0020707707 /DNA_START=3329 /DNA_END=3664 /DNA_ORIENTATION=+